MTIDQLEKLNKLNATIQAAKESLNIHIDAVDQLNKSNAPYVIIGSIGTIRDDAFKLEDRCEIENFHLDKSFIVDAINTKVDKIKYDLEILEAKFKKL